MSVAESEILMNLCKNGYIFGCLSDYNFLDKNNHVWIFCSHQGAQTRIQTSRVQIPGLHRIWKNKQVSQALVFLSAKWSR